ncbi:MAG: CoA-binding protein [Dehalococcoidia bacterium]|nr:CoA-binding protein [Dehalococcoidia bacterium]
MKVDFAKLDRAFNPRCVAVVGDSKMTNFEWLRGQSVFKGNLYSVHMNPQTIEEITALGFKNYTSLLDIPEPIDLVIVAVSRTAVLSVIEDCIRRDVAAAHVFAAGFSETGTEEGRQLERALVERARQANFHIIGPNCMGLFNPAAGIKQSEDQYTGAQGAVGFISQSGTFAITFSLEAHLLGIDINKSVSFGNGVVLESTDFLEYFGQDPGIRVIGIYLEGVKDGTRFFKVLKDVANRKPVVILKGGQSEEGARAIASHTGSMAVPNAVWDAVIKQCGAVKVKSTDELVDTIKGLLFLPPVKGNRVVIAGGSGGHSVVAADIFAREGLSVPPLTQASYDELATFFNPVGGSYRNPIDSAGPVRRDMKRILEVVGRDANIDNIVFLSSTKPGRHITPEQIQNSAEMIDNVRKAVSKPVIAIAFLYTPNAATEARQIILKMQERGIPAFPSYERGARALRNVLEYYTRKTLNPVPAKLVPYRDTGAKKEPRKYASRGPAEKE